MPVALLTGFDAWGSHAANSSWEAVAMASPSLPGGWSLQKVKLPVSWERSYVSLADVWTPEVGAVVACGMAEIKAIHLEQIAINLTAPAARDADGQIPPSGHVVPEAPPAYFGSLPTAEIHAALARAGIPAQKSPHGGVFLCNFIFYRIMHRIHSGRLGIPGGFIHVPALGTNHAADLRSLARGVEIAVETAVGTRPSS